jgi:hypothetical protein
MQMIRPSAGFFWTIAALFAFGGVQGLLGGYWAVQAHKPGSAAFGFVAGSLAVWFAVHFIRRGRDFAAQERAAKKSAEAGE